MATNDEILKFIHISYSCNESLSFYLHGVFSLIVLSGTQYQDCYLKICGVANLQPANGIYRPAHRVHLNNVYDTQCFLLQVCLL